MKIEDSFFRKRMGLTMIGLFMGTGFSPSITGNVEKGSISRDVEKRTIKKPEPAIGTRRCDFMTNLWRRYDGQTQIY